MPTVTINGCRISYQEFGRGVPVVLTPGGRWAGYVQRALAAELAKDFRVITWDRRNTDGASDIVIEGDVSEADIWADDLAALIRTLGLGPCYVGEYAGCRTTPLLCIKHPDTAKGLMLAWPSGGEVPAESVPRVMYRPYLRAALRGGMAEVAAVAPFARSIEQNAANRDALLRMNPLTFIRQMAYWESCLTTSGELVTAGCRLSDAQWSSISVPAIVTGGNDPVHPTVCAQRIHKLIPNSQYHEPVVTFEEWSKLFGVVHYPIVSDLQGQRIAPVWRDFIRRAES
jgi:pimeloyl-ACP methyl ester carboxylesterase